jgi:hypothetical protein
MSNPHGILVYNSNTLFVADTDNGCIRSFGESHRIIIGKPMTSEIRPTKLLTNKSRNVLYYLSKNYLRSSNIDGSRDAVLYESDKIKSFALTDEDKAFVLEETNE